MVLSIHKKLILSLFILSGFNSVAFADFYVIPVIKNALGQGCFSFKGLTYCDMDSPTTTEVWLDRNLGARKVCESSERDKQCFGDYYQWGRVADGHEFNSVTTSDPAPWHNAFIINDVLPGDWTTADSDGSIRAASWNPCPSGYRVPTKAELEAEAIVDGNDAFSKLKLPTAEYRSYSSGNFPYYMSTKTGMVWSSSPDEVHTWALFFTDIANISPSFRAGGASVHCLKE